MERPIYRNITVINYEVSGQIDIIKNVALYERGYSEEIEKILVDRGYHLDSIDYIVTKDSVCVTSIDHRTGVTEVYNI